MKKKYFSFNLCPMLQNVSIKFAVKNSGVSSSNSCVISIFDMSNPKMKIQHMKKSVQVCKNWLFIVRCCFCHTIWSCGLVVNLTQYVSLSVLDATTLSWMQKSAETLLSHLAVLALSPSVISELLQISPVAILRWVPAADRVLNLKVKSNFHCS